MTPLFFLLLVSSSAAWYLLGSYDGSVKGYKVGFEQAKYRYKRRKHPVTGRFLRGDEA